MKFELVSTKVQGSESKHKLEMLAISSNMEHFAANRLGRIPEVGEEFEMSTSWPSQKDGIVAATQDDYEKYGTCTASGVFVRVS